MIEIWRSLLVVFHLMGFFSLLPKSHPYFFKVIQSFSFFNELFVPANRSPQRQSYLQLSYFELVPLH